MYFKIDTNCLKKTFYPVIKIVLSFEMKWSILVPAEFATQSAIYFGNRCSLYEATFLVNQTLKQNRFYYTEVQTLDR